MSRPIARVVFSVLIALALLVGVYTTVVGARNEQAQLGAGLNLSLDRNRITVDGADSSAAPYDALENKGEGGCNHEAQFDAYD
jgi:hypothetical protein